MSEFDDIQRLIRLKRHELPPEDFVDDFVASFQQRQRAELLNRSARGLLWERVTTYFDGLMTPKYGWATAGLVVVALGALSLRPAASSSGTGLVNTNNKTGAVELYNHNTMGPISDEEVKQLLSSHYKGGVADDDLGRSNSIAHKAEPDFLPLPPQGGLLPAGFKLDAPR